MYLYKDLKNIIQNTVFADSVHLITTICKVYEALLINLLIDIVFALTEIM